MSRRVLSLSSRIFLYMILLVILASVMIAALTIYQYKEQSQDYHRMRLERKETQLISSINYVLKESEVDIRQENLEYIFEHKINQISKIHNVSFNLYKLDGQFIISSKSWPKNNPILRILPSRIRDTLNLIPTGRFVQKNKLLDGNYRSSYRILSDLESRPLCILNLPYFDDDSLNSVELKEFLVRIGYTYIIMIIVAVVFAFFISKYITKSLKSISDKMHQTRFEKRNKKITLAGASSEIKLLVESYNNMIDALNESAIKLASTEREQAWREMAKQVAHEIKNPLTPMRLTIQNFQNKFNPADKDITSKVDEYSRGLIQQIDTMSKIAEAFSSFAEMPPQRLEMLDFADVIESALDIFPDHHIKFIKPEKQLKANFDRDQLNRIITNLVKNAIQSVPEHIIPKIQLDLLENKKNIIIKVSDNGSGIQNDIRDKIFEPKFTTKTSGMGLGLPMIKNIVKAYDGKISYTTSINNGTAFKVSFPKNKIKNGKK